LLPIATRQIVSLMIPYLEQAVSPQHSLIHTHRIGREFLALASHAVARKRGLPFVLTPYHHHRWRGYRYSQWTRVYRAADAVLTLTEAERRDIEGLGVSPERIHLIGGAAEQPMPADGSRFRARISNRTDPIVLFLGQLYRYKGFAELVTAADDLHAQGMQFELVLVGPETPFSRRFLAKRQRPWLWHLGRVDDQTKWDAVAASTVVCLPSHQESFGRVYLEAWSMGKPVIGGRIPAVSEIIADGETGLLVDPGSTDQLAYALASLLTDEHLAMRLGRQGRAQVETRFSWSKVASRVEAVYDALLQRQVARPLPR
jgi:glycosyltransferase involved in cell wall biosynthesis